LTLIVTFLRKLSVFMENKDAMYAADIVNKVSKYIPCSSQALVVATLRLLFNLSFDAKIRMAMINSGLVPRLVNLLKTPAFRARTLKLLYHLSVEDRCKAMYPYSDGMCM
jgi:hypothetical protein